MHAIENVCEPAPHPRQRSMLLKGPVKKNRPNPLASTLLFTLLRCTPSVAAVLLKVHRWHALEFQEFKKIKDRVVGCCTRDNELQVVEWIRETQRVHVGRHKRMQ